MASHPDLAAEQAHIDRAYDSLERSREEATRLRSMVEVGKGGTEQARWEREMIEGNIAQRLASLQLGDASLVFGRIDRTQSEGGDSFYIGRLAVADEHREPLVVDWRAPVAEPFYRATGRSPMGLVRRRHFATRGRKLLGIEDELFGEASGVLGGELTVDDEGKVVRGAGALISALEEARTGRLTDIVATIQGEQDEIIRAPLAGILVVQGGPGTGKTAVALHRAAYLLYTHRFPLERQGVLVVGPNLLFLRYIEQVLPSLGESGVVLSTLDGLVPDAKARASEAGAVARLKGDPRMATFVRRAMRTRQRPLRRDVEVPFGSYVLRVTTQATDEIVRTVRRRGGSHNARRRQVELLLTRRLVDQHERAVDRAKRLGIRARPAVEDADDIEAGEVDRDDLGRQLRRVPEVVEILDRIWPVLTPHELLHDLFGAPALIAAAGKDLLSRDEMALLHRPRSARLEDIPWTSADLPLLDEARVLLGSKKPRDEDDLRTFGHIVVDEAQDLSPMQMRVLGRRSMSGSMTIVGDIGQATGQWAPRSWGDALSHLHFKRDRNVVELTVNYRTPAEIMDLAGRVLAVAAPDVRPPRSVRSTDTPPAVVQVEASELAAVVAETARREAGAGTGPSVAVIFPPSMHEVLADGMRAAGVAFGEPEQNGLDEAITLVPVTVVKGLEFDSIIVVEPSGIVAESAQGLRALFVALTRATKRLTIVHADPLPEVLASG